MQNPDNSARAQPVPAHACHVHKEGCCRHTARTLVLSAAPSAAWLCPIQHSLHPRAHALAACIRALLNSTSSNPFPALLNCTNAAQIVEAYGSLLAEMGDMEQAIAMLRRAVEISPDAGHEKYMYLGQLLEGEEALGMMRRGIELLQVTVDQAVAAEAEGGEGVEAGSKGAGRAGEGEEMEDAGEEEEEEDDDPPPTAEELQEQLCSALCSLAESLMNQADDVEGVAGEVEGLLARAKATCSSSPEPGQALASLRYEQQRPAEAVEVLRESMQLWFKRRSEEDEEGEEGEGDEDMGEGAGAGGKKGGKGKKGSAEEEGDSEDELGEAAAARQRRGAAGAAGSSGDGMEEDEDEDDDEEGILPSYEFRFECAKLLLELDESTEDAIQVRAVVGGGRRGGRRERCSTGCAYGVYCKEVMTCQASRKNGEVSQVAGCDAGLLEGRVRLVRWGVLGWSSQDTCRTACARRYQAAQATGCRRSTYC